MVFAADHGTNLKMLRTNRGVSQMQLEVRAGLALGTVSRIENLRINPTKETLFKIAEVLELSQREILQLLGIKFLESDGL